MTNDETSKKLDEIYLKCKELRDALSNQVFITNGNAYYSSKKSDEKYIKKLDMMISMITF